MPDLAFEYDAFISHATEDKASFVEGLALELRKLGLRIWFDKFSLKIGDSLRKSIEEGLAKSRFGIVIFSPSFFNKNWTQAELNGLFAIEMGGRKTILPVWHQISSEEMRRFAPIQSDKYALRSADGIVSVARALVEEIRPELFSLDNSTNRFKLAVSHLKGELERKYPGYAIRVTSGPGVALDDLDRDRKGVVISRSDGQMRVDAIVGDPVQFRNNPPHVNLSFKGEGISKIRDLIRTGKPQKFLDGEYTYQGGNMPLIPEEGLPEGTELRTKSAVNSKKPQAVRLVVSTNDTSFEIPILDMRPTRAGTDEAEVLLSHHTSPLSMSITIAPHAGDRDINLETSFAGFTFTQILRSIKIGEAILDGAELRIFDIATGKVFFHGRLNEVRGNLYPAEILSLVEMVKNIESHFGLSILWPSKITDDDLTAANLLNCLITGEEYGTNFSANLSVVKDQSTASSLALMLQGPVCSFHEPLPGNESVVLFGHEIQTEPWGFQTEQIVLEDPEALKSWLATASDGDNLTVPIKGISPTFVKWKNHLTG